MRRGVLILLASAAVAFVVGAVQSSVSSAMAAKFAEPCASCSSGWETARNTDTRVVVKFQTGRIGSLRLNHSKAAAVRAFAGKPDFTGLGSFKPVDGFTTAEFRSFGYGCAGHPRSATLGRNYAGRRHGAGVWCGTIYYLLGQHGPLAAFFTSSNAFRTRAGTYVGMNQAEANEREGVSAIAGCGTRIDRRGNISELWLANVGGTTTPPSTIVTTGKVAYMELESTAHRVGLEFC